MGASLMRSRWAAIGAAVAVSLGAGGGLGWYANAADSSPSSFISITPCRLFDTRPAPDNVGNRATPLTSAETFNRPVWGTNGSCTIPPTATGIAFNLTVPDPTVTGFIKVYPADAAAPNASAINPVAGGGTKANSGIVGLSSTGAINLFNLNGPINALLDITGYFLPATGGLSGTIPSGQTVTGNFGVTGTYSPGFVNFSVSLPAKAPVALTTANVNFRPDAFALTIDDDAACTGTAEAPTAPPGKVCLYPYSTLGVQSGLQGFEATRLGNQAFYVTWTMTSLQRAEIYLTWAYTAP